MKCNITLQTKDGREVGNAFAYKFNHDGVYLIETDFGHFMKMPRAAMDALWWVGDTATTYDAWKLSRTGDKSSTGQDERIMHAAIVRSDNHILLGKSHADIIIRSPYGTCKEGSLKGFLTSKCRFVDNREAATIAFVAKQIPTPRTAVFSEALWSKKENGLYDYDAAHGYVLKTEGNKP